MASAGGAGMLGKSDPDHLEFATRDNRILITHNRLDFERLATAYWSQGMTHSGIVLAIRRADTYELARRLLPVLHRYDQDRLAQLRPLTPEARVVRSFADS